jgi:hypothetical protein
MERRANSDHLYGDSADLFKTGDIFGLGAILKKAPIKTPDVPRQNTDIYGEKDQRGYAKYGEEYRKRMSEKEQYTKVY